MIACGACKGTLQLPPGVSSGSFQCPRCGSLQSVGLQVTCVSVSVFVCVCLRMYVGFSSTSAVALFNYQQPMPTSAPMQYGAGDQPQLPQMPAYSAQMQMGQQIPTVAPPSYAQASAPYPQEGVPSAPGGPSATMSMPMTGTYVDTSVPTKNI